MKYKNTVEASNSLYKIIKLSTFMLILCLLYSVKVEGSFSLPPAGDPLERMNYRRAFKQDSIYKKQANLLRRISPRCAENIDLSSQDQQDSRTRSEMRTFDSDDDDDSADENTGLLDAEMGLSSGYFADTDEWKSYERKCLRRLAKERRWTLSESARECGLTLGLLGCATLGVVFGFEDNHVGVGFAVYSLLFSSAFIIKEMSRSFYNLMYPPAGPLDEYEKSFAVNKCFIPREMWSQITANFMLARKNSLNPDKYLNFLDFSLGLTLFRPKLATFSMHDLDRARNFVFRKVEAYFNDYDEMNELEHMQLRMNIGQFMHALCSAEGSEFPRYLYLHGPGGIGKTNFVRKLSKWINKALPGATHFESFSVSSGTELEGTSDKPGVFLRVLRNQCKADTTGSIVLMDEADWVNKPDLVNAAKRTFNGRLAEISTTYFGSGSDGTGITFKVPPMLIILSANVEIEDPALKTRFDPIAFPSPKTEAYVRYGQKLLQQHPRILSFTGTARTDLSDEVNKKASECSNFRAVEASIPAIVEKHCFSAG